MASAQAADIAKAKGSLMNVLKIFRDGDVVTFGKRLKHQQYKSLGHVTGMRVNAIYQKKSYRVFHSILLPMSMIRWKLLSSLVFVFNFIQDMRKRKDKNIWLLMPRKMS